MPFRKLTKTKRFQLTGLIILALALYLAPNLCLASCPMQMPEKCCCDHQTASDVADEITTTCCCSIKPAPTKDEAALTVKPVQVSSPVIPFYTITLSELSSQTHETPELPIPVARLAVQSPVLRI